MLVHCSRGSAEVLAGMRWQESLTGSWWEVVRPSGTTIYSPSGFGGTPNFWCRWVEGKHPEVKRWLESTRNPDLLVEFCGDSIAAALMRVEA